MLCKRCKTAVMDSDTVCGYCGTRIKKKSYFWLIYVASVIVIFFIFVVLGNMLSERDSDDVDLIDSNSPEYIDAHSNENNGKATERPTATPFVAFDSVENRDEVIALTENVAKAASKYVNAGTMYIYFLSKNGYLYDDVNGRYISTADLVGIEGYDDEYADEQALILYLRAREFAATGENGEPDDRLEIFCAYETMRGFYISSPDGYIGIIAREALRELLLKYDRDNGAVTRFSADSEAYAAIGNAIVSYEAADGTPVMRYLAGNDRFAFAVASLQGHDNIIKEYALIYENNEWEIFLAGFENLYDYKTLINRAYPDFDLDIFPSYSLYFHSKFLRTDFDGILEILMEKEYITARDGRMTFACGTDLFSYHEFLNGRKILCYTPPNSELSAYSIANYVEGENVMRVLSKDPPLFILKQD